MVVVQWRRQLGLVLTVTLALQPVVFAVCLANCLPYPPLAVSGQAESSRGSVECHQHAGSIGDGPSGQQTAYSVSSTHCDHQSIPSLKLVVETLQRAASLFVVTGAGQLEVGTHVRALPLRANHAPPGPSTGGADVLRL